MNNHLKILKLYQAWRKDTDATLDDLELTAKAIGEALEWAIGELESSEGDSVEHLKMSAEAEAKFADQMKTERDEALARVERMENHMIGLQQSSDGVAGLHLNGDIATWDELMEGGRFEEWLMPFTETPAQSTAHIKAKGARYALKRAMEETGFTATVVRVDALQAVIADMENSSDS